MDKTKRHGKGRTSKKAHSSLDPDIHVQAQLQVEREDLIQERQGAVAGVLDKHDDLVSKFTSPNTSVF